MALLRVGLIVSVMLLVLGHSQSWAELVTIGFQGMLTQSDSPLNLTWNPGQTFFGTYTYESTAINHGAPGEGFYKQAPQDFHVTIGTAEMAAGDRSFWGSLIGGLGSITIQNGAVDSYQVAINYTVGPAIP